MASQGPEPDALRDALGGDLDALVVRGARRVRVVRGYRAKHRALGTGAFMLLVGPALVLLLQLVQMAAGADVWDPRAPHLMIAILLPWMLWALVAAGRATRRPVARARALALFDRAAHAEERLVTADALMRARAHGPFVEAALEDAHWFVRPATAWDPGRALPHLTRTPVEHARVVGCAAGSILLAFFALLLGGSNVAAVETARIAPPALRPGSAPAVPYEHPPRKPDVPETQTPQAVPGLPAKESGEAAASAKPVELPDEVKQKEGVGGSGRSARAESSRGNSDARGAPTNQSQQSKKPTTKKPSKRDKQPAKKKKPFKKPPQGKKAAGEESGSTSGRGSSRGSNRNPVTSDWTSKDQVTSAEDEEVEDDEEIEDETSDSEARGGVQPHLRSRKPPVSRDLGIGFGNQPNPNANGRGGPSQPKKSRGTASLVLGVPIPDRVKGQPNPGKTKVTQERVEPRRERAAAGQAGARTPRRGPSTVLARPGLRGWLRELVRTYFLERHAIQGHEQESKKR